MRLVTVMLAMVFVLSLLAVHESSEALFRPKKFRIHVTMIKDSEKSIATRYGPGEYGRKIRVDSRKRFYEIHVPPSYKVGHPVPLVLVFHGGGSDPGTIRFESRMDRTADRGGFIVVYPAGTNKRLLLRNRMLLWNDGRPYKDGKYSKVDDVKFVKEILMDVKKLFAINAKQVYACGYSNGAQFSYRLAKQLSDQIAAIAAVAGQRPADDFFPPPPGPMSIMQFAGKKDTIGPYDGGSPHFTAELRTSLKPVTETIKTWVDFNGCSAEPEVKRIGRAVMKRYSQRKGDAEVVLWTLEDGGHTWPGGQVVPAAEKFGLGNINRDISASDLIWEFFKRHTLK